MHLEELSIKNFRKYGNPGLSLKLNKRLNVLVGENDSGKTAIISAIKLALSTHGFDSDRVEYEDFHLSPDATSEDDRADSMEISLLFRDLRTNEAKNFLEWLHIVKNIDGHSEYALKITLSATRQGKNVSYDVKAGATEEGKYLSGEARNLLRVTYLKPLRDAETELAPRRNSRLSQIFNSHKTFENENGHVVLQTIKEANDKIESYFKGVGNDGLPISDQAGKELLDQINTYLNEFSDVRRKLSSQISIADLRLKNILERLSLQLLDPKPGLGSHNVLFIAAEMLLLQRQDYEGVKMALVEEIEAHLHVQSQIRLIEYLEQEVEKSDMQLILTTHSTAIASKIKLAHLFICQGGKVFPMSSEATALEKGDYLFLERFLDSTKADLFFAQGVIMVEGDAESLLIPTFAKIIGFPLTKYGVTVLNVGGTAFLRYARIFCRKDPSLGELKIPVACITDLDIKPDVLKQIDPEIKTLADKLAEGRSLDEIIEVRKQHIEGQKVRVFISPCWTLEHDIAIGSLQEDMLRAVLYAKKIESSNKYALTEVKKLEVEAQIEQYKADWKAKKYDSSRIAAEIYHGIVLKEKVSKAIIAQCLATILCEKADQEALKQLLLGDDNIRYLIDAIKYVTEQEG